MSDSKKTKKQLIAELLALRRRVKSSVRVNIRRFAGTERVAPGGNMKRMWLAVAAWGFLYSTPALACGGFFCNASTMEPVQQTAERLLFRVNSDETITAFVEVQYSGDADQFA